MYTNIYESIYVRIDICNFILSRECRIFVAQNVYGLGPITIQNQLGELESQYRYFTFNINIVPAFPPAARFSFPVTENNDKSIHLFRFPVHHSHSCYYGPKRTGRSTASSGARFQGQTAAQF